MNIEELHQLAMDSGLESTVKETSSDGSFGTVVMIDPDTDSRSELILSADGVATMKCPNGKEFKFRSIANLRPNIKVYASLYQEKGV